MGRFAFRAYMYAVRLLSYQKYDICDLMYFFTQLIQLLYVDTAKNCLRFARNYVNLRTCLDRKQPNAFLHFFKFCLKGQMQPSFF